jgi:hypothetical protein
VRAKQKFFRVMTRDGEREARIFVLIPTALSAAPILPTDLFGSPFDDYACGALIDKANVAGSEATTLLPSSAHLIAGVRLKRRIVRSLTLRKTALDCNDVESVRAVIASCPQFHADRPCSWSRFRSLWFQHPEFEGSGAHLLEHASVRTRAAYLGWLASMFPEIAADVLLSEHGVLGGERWCEEGVEELTRRRNGAAARAAWSFLSAQSEERADDPEQIVARSQELRGLGLLLDSMASKKPRLHHLLIQRFGLRGEEAQDIPDIAAQQGVSHARARQLVQVGIAWLVRRWGRMPAGHVREGRLRDLCQRARADPKVLAVLHLEDVHGLAVASPLRPILVLGGSASYTRASRTKTRLAYVRAIGLDAEIHRLPPPRLRDRLLHAWEILFVRDAEELRACGWRVAPGVARSRETSPAAVGYPPCNGTRETGAIPPSMPPLRTASADAP